MRFVSFVGLMATMAAMLSVTIASAHPEFSAGSSADEISRALKGKVCTSRVGATFAFKNDGDYFYDGLWTDHGHYSVHDGAVTILLESGLEREFAISRRGGVLYWRRPPSHAHDRGARTRKRSSCGRLSVVCRTHRLVTTVTPAHYEGAEEAARSRGLAAQESGQQRSLLLLGFRLWVGHGDKWLFYRATPKFASTGAEGLSGGFHPWRIL